VFLTTAKFRKFRFFRRRPNWQMLSTHRTALSRHVSRHVFTYQQPTRSLFLLRRRPLYQPVTSFGRGYLRFRNFTLGLLTIGVATFSVFYCLDARSAVHRHFFTPALRLITPDPEDAHRIAILALKYGIHPKDTHSDDPRLAVEVSFS
jgi:hypothetical protein